MSSLTMLEKSKLEKLFGMESGYVLNFSDRTFANFFSENGNFDIHTQKYQGDGTSKAKKLREFWRLESDHTVGDITLGLITHYESYVQNPDVALVENCKVIAVRLKSGTTSLSSLKSNEAVCDSNYISKQIRRMETSIHEDPSLAIGTAKELIETCCKTILAERGIVIGSSDDIPKLTKAVLKSLDLVPENVDEATRGADVVKRLLSNLGTIGNNLAELRGLYGTGHGKAGSTNGLAARHAKLAVGSASTLVTFLFDSHMEDRK